MIAEKVPTAGWLNYKRYGTFANIYAGAPEEKAYAWTIAQVKSILKDENLYWQQHPQQADQYLL